LISKTPALEELKDIIVVLDQSVTSIDTSLKRDRRFRKMAANTFEAVEEKLQAVWCSA
jgi:hypothetical protein